jgi:lipoprotein-anchoring transpeptidase ErfK/SrfK
VLRLFPMVAGMKQSSSAWLRHSTPLPMRHAWLLAVTLAVAPAFAATKEASDHRTQAKKAASEQVADKAKDQKPLKSAKAAKPGKPGKPAAKAEPPGPLADFGKEEASADVKHVANWVSYTRNNKKKSFVLIDKKEAQLYVFDPRGKLKSRTPILLGKAIGDHSVPGIGTKPMSKIKEDEKTTPAGRFLAEHGRNTRGEDIIWIDYNAAVSMHRLRKVKAEEQRAQRMATPEASDNRISYGCVNVPAKFYDSVLKPSVSRSGAYVYVLPETKTPQQLFGSFDVPPAKVQAEGGKGEQVARAGDSTTTAKVR